MYTLKHGDLEVHVMDPVADQARFGVRYCTGGYIFQVVDARHGDLLSGPTYPHDFNWFDGQGIPDSFNQSPLRDPADPGSVCALVLGVGLCDLQSNVVREFCNWSIEQEDAASITMRTAHRELGYVVDIERTVWLSARTVSSTTRLVVGGTRGVPIRWFPHPFYPHPETDELLRVSFPIAMPENDYYEITQNGFIARKSWPWSEGHFQALDHYAQSNLVLVQRHPKLGMVSASCTYVPAFFPIWGNQYPFSWEPYLERMLVPGQELNWSIDYDF